MISTEFPPLSSEIIADRTPNCISYWLRNLWLKQTGSSSSFITEKALGFRPAKDYSNFMLHNYEITLVLEYLHKAKKLHNDDLVIENNRLREEISAEEWNRFIAASPLNGVNIGVIGGSEARIFAEMGARAIGFDPHLDKLPKVELSNLKELSVYFNRLLAEEYAGRFDLTLSSWLFDQGSGLTDNNLLTYILEMTKHGGFSIHNGNLLPELVQRLQTPVKLLEIIPSFRNTKPNSSDIYFVLQKR